MLSVHFSMFTKIQYCAKVFSHSIFLYALVGKLEIGANTSVKTIRYKDRSENENQPLSNKTLTDLQKAWGTFDPNNYEKMTRGLLGGKI